MKHEFQRVNGAGKERGSGGCYGASHDVPAPAFRYNTYWLPYYFPAAQAYLSLVHHRNLLLSFWAPFGRCSCIPSGDMAPIFVFFQNFSVLADVPVPAFPFANDLTLPAAIAVRLGGSSCLKTGVSQPTMIHSNSGRAHGDAWGLLR